MRHDTSMTTILQGAKMHANDLSHACSRDRAVQICMCCVCGCTVYMYPLSFSICWVFFPSLRDGCTPSYSNIRGGISGIQ